MLSDFLRNRRRAVLNAAGLMGETVAKAAADIYSPKGANFPAKNSLAKGIVALNPRHVGRFAECTVVSTARSKSGFDYARFQHDRTLRHVTFMPRSLSYVDFGKSGTREKRYQQGYNAAKAGSPRYPSQYLFRAGAATKAQQLQILRGAL